MPEIARTPRSDAVPLTVGADGALLRTDLFLENLWAALHADVAATLGALLSGVWHPARLRRRLARIAQPDPARLPRCDEVRALVDEARAAGRRVVLVSGADQALVETLGTALDLPGPHFGSDGVRVLTGRARADRLVAEFGAGGFDHVGHGRADLPCWRAARDAIAVAPAPGLAARLGRLGKPVRTLGSRWRAAALLRGMRPYQWVKNLLLLLPALAAHDLTAAHLLPVLVAIVAFSALTSSVYLVNDMLDLDADRQHPSKRHRPIASGALPIGAAMVAVAGLLAGALILGRAVGPTVLACELLYLATASTYSLWLKHRPWIDLVVLASLYALRILTGSEAAGIGLSPWIAGFSFAVFFTLSAVKRLTELARSHSTGALPGRAYSRATMPALLRSALAGTGAAVVIFLLYTGTAATEALYSNRTLLRLAVLPIAAWLLRMVWRGQAGHENYDPVVFALHDRPGQAIAAAGLACLLLAL